MKRLGMSLLIGLLITVALAVFATTTDSRRVVKLVFWHCALAGIGPRECGQLPDDICEGTPVDVILGLFCLVVMWPLYSALTYLVLTFVAKARGARPLK